MAVCGCVWLCVVFCGCVWLCVVVCGCMWLFVACSPQVLSPSPDSLPVAPVSGAHAVGYLWLNICRWYLRQWLLAHALHMAPRHQDIMVLAQSQSHRGREEPPLERCTHHVHVGTGRAGMGIPGGRQPHQHSGPPHHLPVSGGLLPLLGQHPVLEPPYPPPVGHNKPHQDAVACTPELQMCPVALTPEDEA